VLALKYFHEFTQEEIATLIGRSPAAVNSLLQRARQAFAEISPKREVFE
jgi:DNA-directed RNA polymerase specialized sigma24 family protein